MASAGANRRPGRRVTLLIVGVTATAILAASYVTNRPAAEGGSFTEVILSGRATGPAPEVGKPAPDFTATTMEGKQVTLSELRGKPVWLTFGATWCQECRVENPDIQAAYERYRGQGARVLSIWIQDDARTIDEYAERIGLTFPRVDDGDGRVASSYRIVGIPAHYFIDSSGVLRAIEISALDPDAMAENLAEIGVDVDRPLD
jgi:cytochrome c biogenesis protein CcmG/thiol:disulfide interchange protein DsbE